MAQVIELRCHVGVGPEVSGIALVTDDNFSARYRINAACRSTGTPWIYASVYHSSGQCAVFSTEGACFQCLYPSPPEGVPDCSQAGVLGVLE